MGVRRIHGPSEGSVSEAAEDGAGGKQTVGDAFVLRSEVVLGIDGRFDLSFLVEQVEHRSRRPQCLGRRRAAVESSCRGRHKPTEPRMVVAKDEVQRDNDDGGDHLRDVSPHRQVVVAVVVVVLRI